MNSSAKESCQSVSKNDRDLSRIVALASGLGLGTMLALSEALRTKDASFSLQFSVKTAIAFVVGFAAAYAYLSRILICLQRTSRWFVRGGLVVLLGLVLIAFIYPLRFPIDQFFQRLGGVAAALCFIAAGLTLIRSLVRSAEREEVEQEAREHLNLNTKPDRA